MARQRPPAAIWRVGGGVAYKVMLSALVAGACCSTAAYGLSQFQSLLFPWLCGLLLTCIVLAWFAWRSAPCGTLRWDGEAWHWSGTDVLVLSEVQCVIDAQRFLLLRVQCIAGKSFWLWLESHRMSATWLAMRRAVNSARPDESDPDIFNAE